MLGKEVYIAMAITKTNAMRILDAEKISYSVHTYENKDGKMDGISVAGKIGKEIEMVYKTLVVKDTGMEFMYLLSLLKQSLI